MSDNLSRNQFGPILVTIDALGPAKLSIHFDFNRPVLDVQEASNGDDPNEGGTVYLSFENMSEKDIQEMFLWLRDEMRRLGTIRRTTEICYQQFSNLFAAFLAGRSSPTGTGLDLDDLSTQVGCKERQDAERTDELIAQKEAETVETVAKLRRKRADVTIDEESN